MGKRKRKHERPILVPIDFSASSEAALLWAVEAARAFGRRIVILHVVHDPHATPGLYMRSQRKKVRRRAVEAREAVERLEDSAEKLLRDFVRDVANRHDLEGVLLRAERATVVGLPATRILEIAERENASMIVMGSQGRTGLARLLLGSKAERVVRLSSRPVVIVKAPAGSGDGDDEKHDDDKDDDD